MADELERLIALHEALGKALGIAKSPKERPDSIDGNPAVVSPTKEPDPKGGSNDGK